MDGSGGVIAQCYNTKVRERPQKRQKPDASFDSRLLVNYVKSCLLDVAFRGVAAAIQEEAGTDAHHAPTEFNYADLACGRGQDARKAQFAAEAAGVSMRNVFLADVAEVALAEAVGRYQRALTGCNITARHINVTDAASSSSEVWPQKGKTHVAVCHLAAHYWAGDEERMDAFLANVDRILHPTLGVFIMTVTDGRWVVRAGRAAMGMLESGATVVTAKAGDATFSIPTSILKPCITHPGREGGHPYQYMLPGHVEGLGGDGVTEYLVHEGLLQAAAAKNNLRFMAYSAMVQDTVRVGGILNPWVEHAPGRWKSIAGLMGLPTDSHMGQDWVEKQTGAAPYRVLMFTRSCESAKRIALHATV